MSSETSQHTLFVSSLPFETTSKELEEFFSEIGPIRSCFVVSDKEDSSKNNNGCGYVIYADPEDASRAIKELKKVEFQGKRRLRIELAIRKKIIKESKESTDPSDSLNDSKDSKDSNEDSNDASMDKSMDTSMEKEKEKQIYRKSLILSQLPLDITKKQLYKKVRKYGTIKSIVFPLVRLSFFKILKKIRMIKRILLESFIQLKKRQNTH